MILDELRRSFMTMFEPSSSKPKLHPTPPKIHHPRRQQNSPEKKSETKSKVKPPKAPSWRDFVHNGERHLNLDAKYLEKLEEKFNSGSQDRKKKRHRKSNLHRTRSQMLLDPDDIPENFTLTLAEARERDMHLSSRVPDLLSADRYMRHAADKCRRWLAGLENVKFDDDENWRRGEMVTSMSCFDLTNVGSSSSGDGRRLSGLSLEEVRSQQTSGLF